MRKESNVWSKERIGTWSEEELDDAEAEAKALFLNNEEEIRRREKCRRNEKGRKEGAEDCSKQALRELVFVIAFLVINIAIAKS